MPILSQIWIRSRRHAHSGVNISAALSAKCCQLNFVGEGGLILLVEF